MYSSENKLLTLVTGSKRRKCKPIFNAEGNYELKAQCIPRYELTAASCTSIPLQLTEVREVLLPPHCRLLTGVWAPQEDLEAIPDGFLHTPCLWGLFSVPVSSCKSWQIISLSPFLFLHHLQKLLFNVPLFPCPHFSTLLPRDCTGEPLFLLSTHTLCFK